MIFLQINYNEEDFIIKIDEREITKICGKKDNYIIEFNDKLYFSTRTQSKINNKEEKFSFFDIRKISFISLPKCFKPTKIYDYYFDNINNKYILIILIDDGVLISLDFTKSIKNKNNSAVFLMESISNKKVIMLTINCFFLFFYFLDWSHFDKISISIRETIIDFINNTDEQLLIENNSENGFANNGFSLSNSNLSLTSNSSNDLIEGNNNRHNDVLILNNNQEQINGRLTINNNNYQRNFIEDLLRIFPS